MCGVGLWAGNGSKKETRKARRKEGPTSTSPPEKTMFPRGPELVLRPGVQDFSPPGFFAEKACQYFNVSVLRAACRACCVSRVGRMAKLPSTSCPGPVSRVPTSSIHQTMEPHVDRESMSAVAHAEARERLLVQESHSPGGLL